MSVRTDDGDADYQTIGIDALEFDSYREVVLDDGEVIIYDANADGTWMQSTEAVDIESMA